MNIHEYQAKELLRSFGLPILNGKNLNKIDKFSEVIKSLEGPPWVIKSQIHAGGRGAGYFINTNKEKGGVRIVDNLEDAKKRPEAMNLLTIFAALSNTDAEKVILDYAGKDFSKFKNDLGDLASSKLSPISSEMSKLMNDKNFLDSIINSGKEKAISVADPVLKKVNEIIGFLSR